MIGEHRPDLIVENQVVVEIKSVERFMRPVHHAQMLDLHASPAAAASDCC